MLTILKFGLTIEFELFFEAGTPKVRFDFLNFQQLDPSTLVRSNIVILVIRLITNYIFVERPTS